jgi:GT2 family glycosyltransferase
MSRLGVVVIGRNEGQRLVRCLGSLPFRDDRVVYVDSGSTDGSAEYSRGLGVEVVALDMDHPFTAARARNEGVATLLRAHSDLRYIQFVDGDCEIREGWMEASEACLDSSPAVVAVCGRRRERYPDRSVFNRLTDMEWDTPPGRADSCGGDALIRVSALQQVGGYDSTLIAGEEPDLCHRMSRLGGLIMRLDVEMTMHDADLRHFGQWWKRSKRAGHAYAENYYNHREDGKGFKRKELVSNLVWGLALPLTAVGGIGLSGGLSLFALGAYIALWQRVKSHRRSRGDSAEAADLYARYCVVGKVAQAQGAIMFFWNRLTRGEQSTLIEYKGSG